jgi:DNA-binding transcriptional regulator YdaS (Cro superfamily)
MNLKEYRATKRISEEREPTLQELSKLLHVSPSLLSKALNGAPIGRRAAKTIERRSGGLVSMAELVLPGSNK